MKINEEEAASIIADYQSGLTLQEVSDRHNRKSCVVLNLLRRNNVYIEQTNRWTNEEVETLKRYYPVKPVNEIEKMFSRHNKQSVIEKAHKLHLQSNYRWSKKDIEILKDNYETLPAKEIMQMMNNRHSLCAIKTKADKLGICKFVRWTADEEKIALNNYSKCTLDEMLKLLPNRTYDSIIHKAGLLGLTNVSTIENTYTQEQKKYIVDNYEILSDSQMATTLNKSPRSISQQRQSLGLYRISKNYSNYSNLFKLFRGYTSSWKSKAISMNNGKCILTGSTDIAVHHIYSFRLIVDETFDELKSRNLLKSINICDYTKNELDVLIGIFLNIHSKYPDGVCLRKDIHELFHKIYGRGGNNQQQFDEFVDNYKNGEYVNSPI